jgi:hypothetical protein
LGLLCPETWTKEFTNFPSSFLLKDVVAGDGYKSLGRGGDDSLWISGCSIIDVDDHGVMRDENEVWFVDKEEMNDRAY